ncbi:hypothetical protein FHX15_003371 [Rhizobium sp. BK650]|nr:hypothetical protein [Rhizobium sp. BK650]
MDFQAHFETSITIRVDRERNRVHSEIIVSLLQFGYRR